MFQLGVPLSNTPPAWKTFLWLVAIYPVLEEYVFRGALQVALLKKDIMRRSASGISIANVITSILFAAMHLFNQPPLWATLVFFPSLAFGWLRDRYNNIHASIVLHMSYNAGFIYLYSG